MTYYVSQFVSSILFALLTIPALAQISNSMLPASLEFPDGLLHRMPPLPLTASVSGKVFSELGTPVPSVTINLSGTTTGISLTNSDGSYFINLDPDGDYAIVPHKSNDVMVSNGITTIDLLLIRQHILSSQLIGSPYRIIAADVDGSGSVTTIDFLHIRSVILQITNSFPHGRLWVFVKSDFPFANPLNPFPYQDFRTYTNVREDYHDQDFIGIKLGDVNFSWDPNTPKTSPFDEVQFNIGEQDAEHGEEIIVPVKVKDFKNITGYQFTLSWNPDVLSLEDINHQALTGYYGMNRISEGYITTSWLDNLGQDISLNDDEIAFELRFKVIGNAGEQSNINIGSALITSEAYNENLELLEIKSSLGMVKVSDAPSIINLEVFPNPFTTSTNISFNLENEETVSLMIYDLYGKKVNSNLGSFATGYNLVEWNGSNLQGRKLPKGIYYIRMEAGETKLVSKVILAE